MMLSWPDPTTCYQPVCVKVGPPVLLLLLAGPSWLLAVGSAGKSLVTFRVRRGFLGHKF